MSGCSASEDPFFYSYLYEGKQASQVQSLKNPSKKSCLFYKVAFQYNNKKALSKKGPSEALHSDMIFQMKKQ